LLVQQQRVAGREYLRRRVRNVRNSHYQRH
jgi:hypothetical protein